MKILLVEDDLSTARVLSATLSGERYTVDLARDGQTSLELANRWQYDIILLDIMIPKLDGIMVCQCLRSQGYQMPILLLTAKNSTHDIVRGLDAGADDYLTKPFVFLQLLARIRALLRRGKNPRLSSLLSWGKLTLNPVSLQASYQGQEIELKPREYKLLELFLKHPRQVFSRNAIIDRLWTSDNYPTEGAVTNLIKDLRKRLKKVGIVEEVIETVFGIGYRLKPVPNHQSKSKQSGIKAIAEAKASFDSGLERRIRVLEEVERGLSTNTLTEPQRERAKEEAHKLVGGLGTFGYPEAVAFVRQIEQLLSEKGKNELTIVRDFSRELASLKQFLSGDRPKLTATTARVLPYAIESPASQQYALQNSSQRLEPSRTKVLFYGDLNTSDALQRVLETKKIELVCVTKPEELWKALFSQLPLLLLLDLDVPTFDGIEICQAVSSHALYCSLPIFVLTARTEPDYLRQAFEAGAIDFVSKPILGPELVSRVVNRIEQLSQKQLSFNKSIETDTDALTKLPNRQSFQYSLQQGWEQSKREQKTIAVILSEIDCFQAYNSDCGYAAGNTCLQQLAIILQQCIPASGLVARYGGAEFAICLPSTYLDTAVRLTETIQQQIFELNIPHQSSTLSDRLTMSLGIVGTVPAANNSVSTFMNTANQALQAAKWRGGNTYCLYSL
ncbi:response regulator [Myxosarcina sp. GI1]|uniref:response regulator n=1 Tax=Myxosarcina sp. GI1 TaxID=1541065 RepID=UPI000564E6A7|nr:response regulator [Myxosarcina sp. GI1]